MSGKAQLSGAEKRKRARQKKLDALLAELNALGWAPPAVLVPGSNEGDYTKEYDQAGEPDLEHPEFDLSYARRLQLITARQMSRTRSPGREQVEHWRRIKDICATIGMTSDRSKLESEVKRLRAMLAAYESGSVKVKDGASVTRPATARGQRGARGPRPVPGPRPGAPEGEE